MSCSRSSRSARRTTMAGGAFRRAPLRCWWCSTAPMRCACARAWSGSCARGREWASASSASTPIAPRCPRSAAPSWPPAPDCPRSPRPTSMRSSTSFWTSSRTGGANGWPAAWPRSTTSRPRMRTAPFRPHRASWTCCACPSPTPPPSCRRGSGSAAPRAPSSARTPRASSGWTCAPTARTPWWPARPVRVSPSCFRPSSPPCAWAIRPRR